MERAFFHLMRLLNHALTYMGQLLYEQGDGAMVELAFSLRQEGVHMCGHLGGTIEWYGKFPACLEGDLHVFTMKFYFKARCKVALENSFAVQVKDFALCEAAQQR